MTQELVNIEVDGVMVQAPKGSMLIEATDKAGVYIPRFCYHKKLSVAANCRMCLVDVERMPKPQPACALPVMDGMKVRTRSAKAIDAQKATMEFLLINHPLDCPICDQGGECELQDLAMGYGSSVSQFTEKKRVVKDKDIGPLIQTDMTRCIHCTRCVRFGEEVAGLRELGATGRGEHMEIGTYVASAVTSELSGNVIDVCPVGALTSKPYRYSARAWELTQAEALAPHDAVGSNLYVHLKGRRVKRVVPREHEEVNEVWIADRDRYSYEGLYAPERLAAPLVREGGEWRETDWETALQRAAEALAGVRERHGAAALGALASPSCTVEELYLLQKLLRGLGSGNIDHRLSQSDFSDDDVAPIYPALGHSLAGLERLDAVLQVGSNVRKEQPLVNHRLRKAARRGAEVYALNAVDYSANYDLAGQRVVPPAALPRALAGVLAAAGGAEDPALQALLAGIEPDPLEQRMAAALKAGASPAILLGHTALAHPQLACLRGLAGELAVRTGSALGYLADGANPAGAWLAGVVPHRGPAGREAAVTGLDAGAMLQADLKGLLLLGVEPELEAADPSAARKALAGAEALVALTAYRTPELERTATVMLPIALFVENEGHYVNAAGRWQRNTAATAGFADSRRAWRALRVLGNLLGLEGFDFDTADEVLDEVLRLGADRPADTARAWRRPERLPDAPPAGLQRIGDRSPYGVDALVRRAPALARTADAADSSVRVAPSQAAELGLAEGQRVKVEQNGMSVEAVLHIDTRVPAGAAWLQAAQPLSSQLGPAFGTLTLSAC